MSKEELEGILKDTMFLASMIKGGDLMPCKGKPVKKGGKKGK